MSLIQLLLPTASTKENDDANQVIALGESVLDDNDSHNPFSSSYIDPITPKHTSKHTVVSTETIAAELEASQAKVHSLEAQLQSIQLEASAQTCLNAATSVSSSEAASVEAAATGVAAAQYLSTSQELEQAHAHIAELQAQVAIADILAFISSTHCHLLCLTAMLLCFRRRNMPYSWNLSS